MLTQGKCTLSTQDGGNDLSGAYSGAMRFGTADGDGEVVWTAAAQGQNNGQNNGQNGQHQGHREVGRYKGGFKSGKMHGKGTFLWANGDKYVGEWLNDMAHGMGVQTRANGSVLHSGRWERDRPVYW